MFKKILYSKLIGNSFWGILNSIIQSTVASVFFILVARQYNKSDFSFYILANTMYSVLISFSNLGLQQWYIREMKQNTNKSLTPLFTSIQLMSGVFFYSLNVFFVYFFYGTAELTLLSFVLGLNILFDSLIYVSKSYNIAAYQQRTTFIISMGESSVKLLIGFINLWWKMDLIRLILLLVLLRLVTMFVHIVTGPLKELQWNRLFFGLLINKKNIAEAIYRNRFFIIIGSISVLYWSIGNFLISKYLGLSYVPAYEISYKVFSIAEIIPVILSGSVFPLLIEKVKTNKTAAHQYFTKIYWIYLIYGVFAYSLARTISPWVIPYVFGSIHEDAVKGCNEMFLTMLVFPTVLLQANMLIALGKERLDMWLNILSLIVYLSIALWGLLHLKDASWVSYGIFISFIVFHLLQDMYLYKKRFITQSHIVQSNLFLLVAFFAFEGLTTTFSLTLSFSIFWMVLILFISTYFIKVFA
ncbi:MAG: lipopolysaccharide biosynthesis protein [Chitinophagaceae bacterium]